jgi:hypothetical protein
MYICSAFVGLDNKLHKMHGTYIKKESGLFCGRVYCYRLTSCSFKAVRQAQEISSFPARSKTNWKMLAWQHGFISETKPHFTSPSITRDNSRVGFSKSWPRYGQRTSRKFDAFYVISRHKTCRIFFFLHRNPSMETLAGLCINFIKIPLISHSGKRSRVHPNITLSQRQTRCGSE